MNNAMGGTRLARMGTAHILGSEKPSEIFNLYPTSYRNIKLTYRWSVEHTGVQVQNKLPLLGLNDLNNSIFKKLDASRPTHNLNMAQENVTSSTPTDKVKCLHNILHK